MGHAYHLSLLVRHDGRDARVTASLGFKRIVFLKCRDFSSGSPALVQAYEVAIC